MTHRQFLAIVFFTAAFNAGIYQLFFVLFVCAVVLYVMAMINKDFEA